MVLISSMYLSSPTIFTPDKEESGIVRVTPLTSNIVLQHHLLVVDGPVLPLHEDVGQVLCQLVGHQLQVGTRLTWFI